MDRSTLNAKLSQWYDEFCCLGKRFDCPPPQFFEFLSNRLIEAGLQGVEEDWDVVRAKTASGKMKRVRITGRQKGVLQYQNLIGIGFGFVQVRDVHPDDNNKLAAILDRLEGTKA